MAPRLLLLLIALGLLGPAGARATPVPDRLVTFGNSWVSGRWPDPAVTPWPDRVAAERHLLLSNRGVGGTVLGEVEGVLAAYVPRRRDDVVVEAVLNDVRLYGWGGLHGYERRLTDVLTYLGRAPHPPASTTIVIDAPVIAWKWSSPWDAGSDRVLDAYAGVVLRVASHFPAVHVVDLRPGWDRHRLECWDGLHPNDAGMARIARLVSRSVA